MFQGDAYSWQRVVPQADIIAGCCNDCSPKWPNPENPLVLPAVRNSRRAKRPCGIDTARNLTDTSTISLTISCNLYIPSFIHSSES